jgi:hypothetical protein
MGGGCPLFCNQNFDTMSFFKTINKFFDGSLEYALERQRAKDVARDLPVVQTVNEQIVDDQYLGDRPAPKGASLREKGEAFEGWLNNHPSALYLGVASILGLAGYFAFRKKGK